MNKKISILPIVFALVTSTYAQKIKIGTYVFKDGAQYSGELMNGKPYGKGETVFKNGDTYKGEYVKGKRQGYGIYQFTDGEKYEGQWYQDQQHGKGIFYFMNNNRYDGTWYQDYQHGEGTMYYYNGDVYHGNWVNDKREGQGTYTWKNGSEYVGTWKGDKKEGQGVLTWNDSSKYDGEWKEDVRELKMLATMLCPPDTFAHERAEAWVADVPYLEIAEQLARNLLWKMAEADEMAVHLLYDRQHAYARTCAFLTFVYLFTAEKPIEAAHLNAFWVEAVRTLASRAFGASSYEKRVALTALKRYGRQSDEQAQRVLGELARFKESADAEEREMYHDLAFEFAFEKAAQHDTIVNRK